MAGPHRDGHRAGLYRRRDDRREDDCREAGRRALHPVPAAGRQHAPDEEDDLRAGAVLAPADADPADGPPA